MNRREFLKANTALMAASITGIGLNSCLEKANPKINFPLYRGFNPLQNSAAEYLVESLRSKILKSWRSWDLTLPAFPCPTGDAAQMKIGTK